jgi:hypothetical protein
MNRQCRSSALCVALTALIACAAQPARAQTGSSSASGAEATSTSQSEQTQDNTAEQVGSCTNTNTSPAYSIPPKAARGRNRLEIDK